MAIEKRATNWSRSLRDMVRAPVDALDLDELEHEIAKAARAHRDDYVTFTSRGRRYTFYWHRKGKRLLVKVGRLAYESKPAIEALAAKLRDVRVCPECGATVPRRGKQRFCTPAHAARHRKRQWSRRTLQRRAIERAEKLGRPS